MTSDQEARLPELMKLAAVWVECEISGAVALWTGSEPGTPGRREMLAEKRDKCRAAEQAFEEALRSYGSQCRLAAIEECAAYVNRWEMRGCLFASEPLADVAAAIRSLKEPK